jgi:hypothetical protein
MPETSRFTRRLAPSLLQGFRHTGILYAMPQATESLLQDSRIDLAQW